MRAVQQSGRPVRPDATPAGLRGLWWWALEPVPAPASAPLGSGVRRRWHGGSGEICLRAADLSAQAGGVAVPDDDGRPVRCLLWDLGGGE